MIVALTHNRLKTTTKKLDKTSETLLSGDIMRGKFEYPPKSFRLLKYIYHLPNFIKLFWRLFQDERVPIYKKAIPMLFGAFSLVFVTVYFLAKLDLIADPIPFIGWLDDLIVLIILIIFSPGVYLFIKACPQDIVLEHVDEIAEGR